MGWDSARDLEAAHGLPAGSLHATLYGGDAVGLVERRRGDREAWLARARRAPACSSTTTRPTSTRPRAPGSARSSTASTGATTCAPSSPRRAWRSLGRELSGTSPADPGPPRRGHRARHHRLSAHRAVGVLRLALHDRGHRLLGELRFGPSPDADRALVYDRADRRGSRDRPVRDRRAHRVLGRG